MKNKGKNRWPQFWLGLGSTILSLALMYYVFHCIPGSWTQFWLGQLSVFLLVGGMATYMSALIKIRFESKRLKRENNSP